MTKNNKNTKSPVCIIFAEGETDVYFYKYLICYLRNKNKKGQANVEIKNLKGVSNFSSKASSKYKNEIKVKYPDDEYKHYVFLAYDTDIFVFAKKPSVNWNNVERKLTDEGADHVVHLKAEKMIEDWLILDIQGICKFLKIKVPKQLKGQSGLEKMQYLYRAANRTYQKGYKADNLIKSLDIGKIYQHLKPTLKPLVDKLYEV